MGLGTISFMTDSGPHYNQHAARNAPSSARIAAAVTEYLDCCPFAKDFIWVCMLVRDVHVESMHPTKVVRDAI